MKQENHPLVLLQALEMNYPEARCELNYTNPWELLVATMLSAQCTDKRVNLVTRKLFHELPGTAEMAAASQEQVEGLIRSTGFFRNKAKNLIQCAQQIMQRHQGKVPAEIDALVALPGVGRKTANVVLGNAFQMAGMVVDTHVKRLAYRFGWTQSGDPLRVEKDLCQLFPASQWTQLNHTLIAHGRACCKAPTPLCSTCPIAALCPRIGVLRCR